VRFAVCRPVGTLNSLTRDRPRTFLDRQRASVFLFIFVLEVFQTIKVVIVVFRSSHTSLTSTQGLHLDEHGRKGMLL
jgi:hypothetical protein